jgi:predicted transcriptional regulator
LSNETASTLPLAAYIVASFISNNSIAPNDIGGLIQSVKSALDGSAKGVEEPVPQEPAHPLRKLVTPDAIFCAECGKRFKSLKRHLMTDHDLTPLAYRAKWGLSKESPMVAPNYSASRSELAKAFGLGQGRQAAAPPSAPEPVKPKPRARKAAPKTVAE